MREFPEASEISWSSSDSSEEEEIKVEKADPKIDKQSTGALKAIMSMVGCGIQRKSINFAANNKKKKDVREGPQIKLAKLSNQNIMQKVSYKGKKNKKIKVIIPKSKLE